jgi:hypothetical protein
VSFTAFQTYSNQSELPSSVIPEPQTTDYESGIAHFNGQAWHIRTARTTPTKPGAFLAFWQRTPTGTTAPFDSSDPADGLLVFINQKGGRGLFRFTREHLSTLGITTGPKPGKRGFRVYPPWCTDLNKQAKSTQQAQAPAFELY